MLGTNCQVSHSLIQNPNNHVSVQKYEEAWTRSIRTYPRSALNLAELFLDGIQLLIEDLVHRKHMDLFRLKYSPQSIVTEDLPLV
jgi:hypothetical protein